jgi:GxxExxY protein
MRNRFERTPQPEDQLARTVIGLAMKVHRILGYGFLETVYRNSLAIELRKANISFECHPKLSVMYEGIEVGVYQADLIIEGHLLLELKAAAALTDEHCIQLVNYLTATNIENGLVINFGAPGLQFRTKTRTFQSSASF